MTDFTQSSETTATTTPDYYNNTMSDLAQSGTAASANAIAHATGVNSAWNPTANQNAAFTNVRSNVGNYQPGLASAGNYYNQAGGVDITGAANPYLKAGTTTSGLDAANPYLTSGTSSAADLVGGYMNPYTQNVVDQIRMANQQNIQQNLSPGITAGAVGGGQFGSKRGADALALGISNANIGALGEQSKALQSGYAQALAAAQAQRANQIQAGSTAGTLQNQFNTNRVTAGQIAGNLADQQAANLRNVGTSEAALADQTQRQGLADVNALATLGEQERALNENKVLAPLDILNKRASLLSGAQLPTTVTKTATGSPLSAISTLGAFAKGIFTPSVAGGRSVWDTLSDSVKGALTRLGVTPEAYSASIGGAAGGNLNGGFGNSDGTVTSPDGHVLTPNADGGYTDSEGNEYDSNMYPI